MTVRAGTPVLLAGPRGKGLPSYAMVVRTLSPHTVRVIITAHSGGRRKGTLYAVPRAALEWRARGCHRRVKPKRRRWQLLQPRSGKS